MSKCDKCLSGWVKVGQGYEVCDCLKEERMRQFFEWSGTSDEHYKFLDDLINQGVITGSGDQVGLKQAIEKLVSTRENIEELLDPKESFRIVLDGTVGSGKSQMATTLALEILKRTDSIENGEEPNRFYFLPVSDIARYIYKDEKLAEIREKTAEAKVLILDDITVESQIRNNKTPAILEELNAIVRDFKGLIIMTTNYTGCLSEYYDALNTERLGSVLVKSKRGEHGKYNSLFYSVSTDVDRRRRPNRNVSFL